MKCAFRIFSSGTTSRAAACDRGQIGGAEALARAKAFAPTERTRLAQNERLRALRRLRLGHQGDGQDHFVIELFLKSSRLT